MAKMGTATVRVRIRWQWRLWFAGLVCGTVGGVIGSSLSRWLA